jgi:hypothetical protein
MGARSSDLGCESDSRRRLDPPQVGRYKPREEEMFDFRAERVTQ